MKSFKQFIVEDNARVHFTFGRMNPPTIGHEKLLSALKESAGKEPYKIFLSRSNDQKKNPLIFESKIKTVRKFFPRHARHVVGEGAKNILDVAVKLYENNYRSVVCVVGEDRLMEFEQLLEKYNGVQSRHGFYEFTNIEIKSAGKRNFSGSGVEAISASTLRECVSEGNFIKFSQGIPKDVSHNDAKRLFNELRVGLGLTEMKTFHHNLKMEPISETREKYLNGELYSVGDRRDHQFNTGTR